MSGARGEVVAESGSWAAVAEWADFHTARTRFELRDLVRGALADLLGAIDHALLVHENDGAERVEVAFGARNNLIEGELLAADAEIRPRPMDQLPLPYGEHVVGRLVLGRRVEDANRARVRAMLAHYATALVNLKLGENSRSEIAAYSAGLQAYEQGVVLFQEQDPDAIAARFLDLCMRMVNAQAGAVLVLERIGDPASRLVLDQVLGMPESLVNDLRRADTGQWWPRSLLDGPITVAERDRSTGRFETLESAPLPPALHTILGAPLSYHGVHVGSCVLLNPVRTDTLIDRTSRLFELGAAIFHRRELEAEAVRNQRLETQLQIAAILQSRFLPDTAPAHPRARFAWRSVAAEYVGGDYVDLVACEDGAVQAIIADVSGHGVDSALVMTSFRASYRAVAPWLEPAALLSRLNRNVVEEVGDTGMFMTSAAIKISADGRRITVANAGHNPVLLYRAATGHIEEIGASGPPMGIVELEYHDETFEVGAGDRVVVYTDGIVEAAAPHDETHMFGMDRLMEVVRETADREPADFVTELCCRVSEFSGHSRQVDDVSVLVVSWDD